MKKMFFCVGMIALSVGGVQGFAQAVWDAMRTPNLAVGQIAYVPMKSVLPGQMRYSQKNIDLKIGNIRKAKGFTQEEGRTILQHDARKSALALKNAAPVMKIRNRYGAIRYVLKDFHHDALANRALAKEAGVVEATMPVKVENDFSTMRYHTFWKYAHNNHLVDLRGVDGRLYINNPPKSFDNMKDDPVRYFVTISARKGGNNQSIEESFGAEYPLWYKRLANMADPEKYPGDVLNARMIENIISQKLIDNGFTYDVNRDGESGSRFEEKVREAHAILSQPKNRTTGFRLIETLGYFTDIKDQLRQLAEQPDPLAK